MRRLAVVAALIVAVAVPVWGQRGGARGGGGRGVAVSRGGFSMGRSGFASGGVVGRSGFSSGMPAFRGGLGFPVRRPSFPVRRPVYVRPVRFRSTYGVIPYSYAIPYGPGYFDSGFYDDGSGYAAQPAYADSSAQGYDAGPVQQSSGAAAPENESYRAAYRAAYQRAQPQPEPAQAEAVTLVFQDGRPQEQIHNYILTRTTLFVQDGRRREIAVADLDLAATEKVNREAGVDFQLPAVRR